MLRSALRRAALAAPAAALGWSSASAEPSKPRSAHACARHRIPRLARARRQRVALPRHPSCRLLLGRRARCRRSNAPARSSPRSPARIFTSRSTRCRSSGVRRPAIDYSDYDVVVNSAWACTTTARRSCSSAARGTSEEAPTRSAASSRASRSRRRAAAHRQRKCSPTPRRSSRRPSATRSRVGTAFASPRRAPRTRTCATRRTTARSRRSTADRAPRTLSICRTLRRTIGPPPPRRVGRRAAATPRRGVDGRFVDGRGGVVLLRTSAQLGPIIKFIHHGRHTAQCAAARRRRGRRATSCRGRGTTTGGSSPLVALERPPFLPFVLLVAAHTQIKVHEVVLLRRAPRLRRALRRPSAAARVGAEHRRQLLLLSHTLLPSAARAAAGAAGAAGAAEPEHLRELRLRQLLLRRRAAAPGRRPPARRRRP